MLPRISPRYAWWLENDRKPLIQPRWHIRSAQTRDQHVNKLVRYHAFKAVRIAAGTQSRNPNPSIIRGASP